MDQSLIELLAANSMSVAGCRVWLGYTQSGYGVITWQGERIRIHRLVYKMMYGKSPAVVRHTCNNPKCWNYRHLEGGDQRDNMHDAIKAGNHVSCQEGYKTSNAKITADDATVIRTSTASARDLAKVYGVSREHIYRIRRKERWSQPQAA